MNGWVIIGNIVNLMAYVPIEKIISLRGGAGGDRLEQGLKKRGFLVGTLKLVLSGSLSADFRIDN